MITFKPNRFQSVNGEEEEEVKCGGCWEGIGDGLSMFVSVSSLSLFMVLYLMCVNLILTFQVIMLSSCLGSE